MRQLKCKTYNIILFHSSNGNIYLMTIRLILPTHKQLGSGKPNCGIRVRVSCNISIKILYLFHLHYILVYYTACVTVVRNTQPDWLSGENARLSCERPGYDQPQWLLCLINKFQPDWLWRWNEISAEFHKAEREISAELSKYQLGKNSAVFLPGQVIKDRNIHYSWV